MKNTHTRSTFHRARQRGKKPEGPPQLGSYQGSGWVPFGGNSEAGEVVGEQKGRSLERLEGAERLLLTVNHQHVLVRRAAVFVGHLAGVGPVVQHAEAGDGQHLALDQGPLR